MAKKMSEFLESKIGPLRMRSALTLLLCVVNFALAYGILFLAFPNLEVQDDEKAADLVD